MVKMPKEFHFKIVSPAGNPSDEWYKCKLVTFVDDIFPQKGKNPGRSPLAYDSHRVVEEEGQTAVLVSLTLSETAKTKPDRTSPLDLAVEFILSSEEFCKQIFDPNSRPHINTLTTRSILGLSSTNDSEIFNNNWNRAALREGLKNPDLLHYIDEEYRADNSSLPNWARNLIFAVAAGITFTIDTVFDAAQQGVDDDHAGAAHVVDQKCVLIALNILQTMMKVRTKGRADEEIELSTFYEEFIRCIRDVVNALRVAVDTHASLSDQTGRHPDGILWTALYQTTEAAAMVATANDETFKEFNKHQEAAEALMVASGTAAAVGLYASMGLVTTQTVAPLATWGLAGVAGIFTTGSLPVVTSTALAVTSWPVLLTAAAVVGGLRYRARLHSGKRDTLHKKMNVHQTFVRAWKVVHDSQLLLTWINCSDGLHPIFADSQSQTRWAQFITRVREASGGETSAIDFDPAAVKSYLDEQRGLLELWLQEHTVREDESGNVTEDE